MKLIRVVIRILLAIGALLYTLGLVINLFDLFTFRKSDAEILKTVKPSGEFSVMIDTVRYAQGALCYAFAGRPQPGTRDAIFFVHGSPGALDAFSPFLGDRQLLARADLIAYDRPGFGQTIPRQEEPSLAEQAAALDAVIRKIGARRNFLVGQSLGCSIIARYAMDYPGRADGLVMIAAPIDPQLEPPNWWRYLLDFPLVRIAVPRPLAVSNAELLPLKQELDKCLGLWPRIDCPVVLVHGDRDRLVPLANVDFAERMLRADIPLTTHVLKDEGHFILWTHVEEIVGMLLPLLN